ncbi:MAG: hypothetical protein R3304_05375 [Longimicrobiales bacterium]|nr:hypothetical protein [Longimicrobiales bacterium]
MPQQNLVEIERDFWTRGADYYGEKLAEGCRMIVPGVGPMSREEVLRGIADG